MKMTAIDDAVTLVRDGQRFLVAAHVSPDGDALGSMLATMHGLRALGKQVVAYDRDPAPARLQFLDGAGEIVTTPPRGPFDATFVHDCGDVRLLGEAFPPRAVTGPLVVLDHHATVRPYGDVVLRDPSASAVGVIVARLLRALGVTLTKPIAEALWCSLVSDTGWFRYSSTDVETLELARACVAAGVQPWQFARRAEEEQPPGRLRLLALVLATLELRGKLALLSLDDEMLSQAGAGPELSDGFVNYARALEGVEVGVLVTKLRLGLRASLRSKGGCDVAAIAAQFDGGGHRAAAGCTIEGEYAAARARLVAAIEKALAE
jgi:phosphoesterase RecJ-like protein